MLLRFLPGMTRPGSQSARASELRELLQGADILRREPE